MSFDQKQYIDKYNKNTYKMFPFRVRKDNIDVLGKLQSVPSMNKYICSLIEHDISPKTLTLKQIKERILPIMKNHHIDEVYLFGSYARGEANDKSDVDIYCDSGDIKTLIDQGYLEDELTEALGKDVDVIFIGSRMDSFFEEQLNKDKIRLC